jgi:hypothetical protein
VPDAEVVQGIASLVPDAAVRRRVRRAVKRSLRRLGAAASSRDAEYNSLAEVWGG